MVRGAVANERRVQCAHHLAGVLVVGTNDDPVGVHEIIDRSPFLEELRVRYHGEFDVDAARFETLGYRGAHQVRRADRYGRLVHHDGRRVQCVADLPSHFQDVAKVGRAVFAGWCADGNEEHLGLLHRFAQRSREMQTPGAMVLRDDLFETRLVNRQNALLEIIDLGLVDIDAVDRVAHFRDAGTGNQTDVAASDDGDVHSRILDLDIDAGVPRRDPCGGRWRYCLLGSSQSGPATALAAPSPAGTVQPDQTVCCSLYP